MTEPSFNDLLRQAHAPAERRAARERLAGRIFPEPRSPEASPTAHHGAADAGRGDPERPVTVEMADTGEMFTVLPLDDIFDTTTTERNTR